MKSAFDSISRGLREAHDAILDPTLGGTTEFNPGDRYTYYANSNDAVMPCAGGHVVIKRGTSARFVMTERGWVRDDLAA